MTELPTFSFFLIITQLKFVNKISQEPLKLGSQYLIHMVMLGVDDVINFWLNSLNP